MQHTPWKPDLKWHIKCLGTCVVICVVLFFALSFVTSRFSGAFAPRVPSTQVTPWLNR